MDPWLLLAISIVLFILVWKAIDLLLAALQASAAQEHPPRVLAGWVNPCLKLVLVVAFLLWLIQFFHFPLEWK